MSNAEVDKKTEENLEKKFEEAGQQLQIKEEGQRKESEGMSDAGNDALLAAVASSSLSLNNDEFEVIQPGVDGWSVGPAAAQLPPSLLPINVFSPGESAAVSIATVGGSQQSLHEPSSATSVHDGSMNTADLLRAQGETIARLETALKMFSNVEEQNKKMAAELNAVQEKYDALQREHESVKKTQASELKTLQMENDKLKRESENAQKELATMKELQEKKKAEKELRNESEERISSEREQEKLRRQTPGKIGCVDEGSKKWEVEVEKIGEKFVFSDYTYIGGVPFRILCRTVHWGGAKNLGVFLYCNDKAPTKTYSASVDYSITLASSVSPERKTTHYKYPFANGHGWPGFIAWTNLVDPSKGYIKNGRITIEAQIKLIWFYKNAIADFSSADSLSDVTLLVGGEEFNICKKHVATYSEYFKTLFFSDFTEKNTKLLELPEVNAKEFEDLLKMIHPQRTKTTVTKYNVERLLRLSDYFIVDAIRWECIDFLKASTDFPLAVKLQFADQYRLPELQAALLSKMTTRETAKTVIDSPQFKSFSVDLNNYVHEKHYALL